MTSIQIRALTPQDRPWVVELLAQWWGSPRIVSCGKVHEAADLPGLAAMDGDQPLGLATYHIDGRACELVTLNSLRTGSGVGSRLVQAVADKAGQAGCERLWLVTTNDNLKALAFYQQRGFKLLHLHTNAIAHARELKPEIPRVGEDGIPIRDELVLERSIETRKS